LSAPAWYNENIKERSGKGALFLTFNEMRNEECYNQLQRSFQKRQNIISTGKITVGKRQKFSILTLFDYDRVLENNRHINSQITVKQQSGQQSDNSPTLLNKKEKNIRNQENARAR